MLNIPKRLPYKYLLMGGLTSWSFLRPQLTIRSLTPPHTRFSCFSSASWPSRGFLVGARAW